MEELSRTGKKAEGEKKKSRAGERRGQRERRRGGSSAGRCAGGGLERELAEAQAGAAYGVSLPFVRSSE